MPKRSFYVRDSELDDYQVKIINKRTDNSFIVKGCAGSGKSILALWKAKQIQNEGRGTYQFIVFTKALMQYMSDGVRQVGINANNVDYHWNWENRKGSPSADYIIVDEAQDFSKEDILKFKSKANKALLLYGDSAQQLYVFLQDKRTVSMEEIAVITGYQTEQLVFNHRLPKKIARLAQKISSTDDDLEGRCKNEGVEKPKVLRYNSFELQLDAIAEIVKNRNFEDVGILFRHNADVERAYNHFQKKGINVEAKFGRTIDLNFNSDNPKLMTYHSAKGLQFEAVFIPECTCSNNDDRNPLYVALTRTYQSLYVMHSGNLSSFFDAVPNNIYETSLTANTELL
ncbi:ATP-binding domain-containing protein [Bacteroidales bacterium OttesenSCG-928-C19]|nr:ATP-binding domain-containing protein [Bacteroidales bacterium OttesenSCG-928-C19]